MNFALLGKLAIAPVIGVFMMALPFVLVVRSFSMPDVLKTDAPGTAVFQIEERAEYTVWREVVGVTSEDEFRVEDKELPAGLSLHIVHEDSGATVPIETSLNFTQTSNGHSKASLFKATLGPGKYKLVSETAGEPMGLVITPDKFSFKGFLFGVVSGILGCLVFVGGCIYAIVVLVRRSVKPAAGEFSEKH